MSIVYDHFFYDNKSVKQKKWMERWMDGFVEDGQIDNMF